MHVSSKVHDRSQSTGIRDRDRHRRAASAAARLFHRQQGVFAINDCPENHVLPVQMPCALERDKKLRHVRIPPKVGHADRAGIQVFELKVFVDERAPEDRLTGP
eukprot:CAMPEP_0181215972 /NCGR_PEP_ID=MMETSP1096-20121128/26317_1 /TAXON_ID=156174 ORGANISM="Chrysochromulina ericina, Strain CCMP281" /NCGR_SAMPLE_ID=MMETSP1096 /ASSEMBLY_ACC=CAM_ASM_000453 /LENGTH=103 /DNA_ID=CAMNT_0023307901 /DNA_START=324 /DNA_END=631 /DNA_ORIENTATION=-